MDVVQLAVTDLVPNPWNVNRMDKAMQRKLVAYLKREGLVEPLVVRPHPKQSDKYELLGGYHRWKLCTEELGYETVPCVVLEGLSDKRAKILSVNLNSMSGQPVPSLLSRLLSDLQQEMPLADLEATLPFDQNQIVDMMSLMQLPEGFADELEEEAEEQDRAAPNVLTIVLDERQMELWEEALAAIEEEMGPCRHPRARAAERLAAAYLAAEPGAGDVS